MKSPQFPLAGVAAVVLAAATLFAQTVPPPPAVKPVAVDETPIELSPFTVTADKDLGYQATNTLAGSRLNTPLADTAAAIDVLTAEFLSDLGATSMSEALEYGTNAAADIGAGQGVTDNGTFSVGGETINVRGIRATRTRNFFPVFTAVDSYNVDRIEEQRGPNSILFGIGSPAGVINANTKRPIMGRSFLHASTMFNSANGYRGAFDANYAVKRYGLGLRLNTVYSHLDDEVALFAYNETKALDLAVTKDLTKKIRVRAEFETSRQEQARAKTRTPVDRVSSWIDAPVSRYTFADWQAPGVTIANYGIVANGTNNRLEYVDNDNTVINYRNLHRSNGTPNLFFERNHPELWDRSANDGGPGQRSESKFQALSAFVEAQLTSKTFLELAYNRQNVDSLSFQFNDQGLRGDPNKFYADKVTANPGAGRLFLEGQWVRWRKVNDFASYRATLSQEIDLRRWGNYRLAAMVERDEEYDSAQQKREVWVNAAGQGLFNADFTNAQNVAYRRHYLFQEGNWHDYHVTGGADGVIEGLRANTGETATSAYRNFNSGQDFDNIFTTSLLGAQARYFSGKLVFGGGYRQDKLKVKQYAQVSPTGGFNLSAIGERVVDYSRWSSYQYEGKTKTLGSVFHVTRNLRLMYNASNNFGQPSTSRREYPNDAPARNTEGTGQDYGLGFSFFDNKVSGRVTRFTTDSKNVFIAGYNLQDTNDALLNALVSASAVTGLTREAADKLRILGTGGIRDQHVEGYEFSLTFNLARTWRLTAHYSYTNGYQTNSYPDQREYRDGDPNKRLGGFGGLQYFEKAAWANLPLVSANSSTVGEYIDYFKRTLASDLAIDGVALAKNRPRKANLFTRYAFDRGPLKALSIGGGVRYQDREQLGVGRNSAGQAVPLIGTRYAVADLMLGYSFRKVLGIDRVSLQLNVSNLFDFSDYLVTGRETNGQINRISFLQPRMWKLGANFDF
jgi:iron complex outermembrane receptor protein